MKNSIKIFVISIMFSLIIPTIASAAVVDGGGTGSVALTCNYKLYASGYKNDPVMDMTYTLFKDGTLQLPFKDKAIIKDGKWDAGGGFTDSLSFYAHESDFAEKFKKIANPSTGKYKCPYLEDTGWDLTDAAYIIKVSDTAGQKMVLQTEDVGSGEEPITEKTKCTYFIKERLGSNDPITKASSAGSIQFDLIMDSVGNKYFKVQDKTSNYITSSQDGKASITKMKSNGYGDEIRFIVKSSDTAALYKQNFKQLEYNQFSCPQQLYVIFDERNNYDPNKSTYIEDYIISPTKGDEKASNVFNATATGFADDYIVDKDGTTVDKKTGKPLNCEAFVQDDGTNLISELFNIIMIIAPILAIVLGSLDFAKASLAQDENALKKAGTNFGKRLIAAVLLFILPLIINLILGIAFDAGVFGSHDVPKVCLDNK